MKVFYSVFYLLLLLTGFACKKDEVTGMDLTIRLQVLYQGNPMTNQVEYAYPDGKTFILTKFSTYMSDLTVQSGSQEETLEEVLLINMTETMRTSAGSEQGYLVYSGKTKLNSIDRIHFNLGLTPEQNSTIPADHTPGTPLAMPGEYWLAWESFIFTKIEGWIDLDGDQMAETGVALHLGSDEVLKSFSFDTLDRTGTLTILIDLAQVFSQDGTIYDIEANPQIHSLSQIESLRELSNNLEKAVTLKTVL